jgi:hypothetical protein
MVRLDHRERLVELLALPEPQDHKARMAQLVLQVLKEILAELPGHKAKQVQPDLLVLLVPLAMWDQMVLQELPAPMELVVPLVLKVILEELQAHREIQERRELQVPRG